MPFSAGSLGSTTAPRTNWDGRPLVLMPVRGQKSPGLHPLYKTLESSTGQAGLQLREPGDKKPDNHSRAPPGTSSRIETHKRSRPIWLPRGTSRRAPGHGAPPGRGAGSQLGPQLEGGHSRRTPEGQIHTEVSREPQPSAMEATPPQSEERASRGGNPPKQDHS